MGRCNRPLVVSGTEKRRSEVSDTPRPALLVVAGLASGGIAILQFALVIGGPPAHRLFGAPEELAAFAARDPMLAAIGPIVFAAIFGIFAAYAFSGAGCFGGSRGCSKRCASSQRSTFYEVLS